MIKNNELIEIHIDGLGEFYACGYLRNEESRFYYIEDLDSFGYFSSFNFINKQWVDKIVTKSSYLDFMEYTVEFQKDNGFYYHLEKAPKMRNNLEEYLIDAIENKRVVQITIDEYDETLTKQVYIESYDDEALHIRSAESENYQLEEEIHVTWEYIKTLWFDEISDRILSDYVVRRILFSQIGG